MVFVSLAWRFRSVTRRNVWQLKRFGIDPDTQSEILRGEISYLRMVDRNEREISTRNVVLIFVAEVSSARASEPGRCQPLTAGA